jgi:hypothetical protein
MAASSWELVEVLDEDFRDIRPIVCQKIDHCLKICLRALDGRRFADEVVAGVAVQTPPPGGLAVAA